MRAPGGPQEGALKLISLLSSFFSSFFHIFGVFCVLGPFWAPLLSFGAPFWAGAPSKIDGLNPLSPALIRVTFISVAVFNEVP